MGRVSQYSAGGSYAGRRASARRACGGSAGVRLAVSAGGGLPELDAAAPVGAARRGAAAQELSEKPLRFAGWLVLGEESEEATA